MNKINLASAILLSGLLGMNGITQSQTLSPTGKLFKNEMTSKDLKNKNVMETQKKFELQPLPYSYDALEPYIDKQTVEIHYSKHHKAYFDNFINAIKGTDIEYASITDIFRNISKYQVAVRNNAGGYFNHTFYWESMKANGGGTPGGKLSEAINKSFGSFDEFRKIFSDAARTRFGSGWAWLSVGSKGELLVSSSPNQDNPLMDISESKGIPILTVDVWEHAYYLKYQNRRTDYTDAFWNLVNWEKVAMRYDDAWKSLAGK